MSYEVLGPSFVATYSWTGVSFAANSVKKIRGPKGMRGVFKEAQAFVTTSFVGTTTPAALQLGPSASLTALLNMPFGTAGSPSQANAVLQAQNITGAIQGQSPNALPWTYAAADTDLTVGIIAGVGTPAGVADLQIVMGWF